MEYLPGIGRPHRSGSFVEIFPGIATLDALITERLLLQIAKIKNLLPSENEIDSEIKYRLANDASLVQRWKTTGRTDAEYRRVVTVEVAQYKLQTQGIIVEDQAIKDLYDLSKADRYTMPKRYVLRVITVKAEADQKKVDAELKAGKSFAAVATIHSSDDTKSNGGKFGEVPLSMLSAPLQQALTKLKKGERTGWLASDKGAFAKFSVDDVLPEIVTPLDAQLKESLRREIALRRGSTKNDISKMIREARSKAEIKITSPEFDQAYKQMISNSENKVGG
jgi:parvulin-like peptidyl-prolyl isomerase